MSKIKKFAVLNIKKLTGGKDPVRIVEEFLLQRGFDPDECQKEKTAETVRWMVSLGNGEDLEMLAEGLNRPAETTVYMGVNVATVPLRGIHEMLVAALEIADGLIGVKVSLVGHYLVLSASLGASGLSVDDLDYHLRLIEAQSNWFRETLIAELGWEAAEEE